MLFVEGFFFSLEKPGKPLTVKPTSQNVLTGMNATFQCYYRDGPQDEVMWEKEDGSLLSSRHVVEKGFLTIENVTVQDKGTYVCRVKTGAQDLTLQVTLKVKSKYLPIDELQFVFVLFCFYSRC